MGVLVDCYCKKMVMGKMVGSADLAQHVIFVGIEQLFGCLDSSQHVVQSDLIFILYSLRNKKNIVCANMHVFSVLLFGLNFISFFFCVVFVFSFSLNHLHVILFYFVIFIFLI